MRHALLVRNLDRFANNRLILLVSISVSEWERADKHLVHNDSYGPPVSCLGVRLFFQNFWRQIGRRANDCLGDFVVPDDPC